MYYLRVLLKSGQHVDVALENEELLKNAIEAANKVLLDKKETYLNFGGVVVVVKSDISAIFPLVVQKPDEKEGE